MEARWASGGSSLDFQSGGRWFEPSLCRPVVSLDKKLYSTFSLFTQVNKWVPAIIMLGGVTLRWTGIPPGGSSNIPSLFMLQKPELSAGLMGPLARLQPIEQSVRQRVLVRPHHSYKLSSIFAYLLI